MRVEAEDVEHISVRDWSGKNTCGPWLEFTFRMRNGHTITVTADLSDRVSAFGAAQFHEAAAAFNQALGKPHRLLLEAEGDER